VQDAEEVVRVLVDLRALAPREDVLERQVWRGYVPPSSATSSIQATSS